MNDTSSNQAAVRPVSWNRILDAIEVIAGKDSITKDLLVRYLGVSESRASEILNVLCKMNLVDNINKIYKTNDIYLKFIDFWELGNLKDINFLLKEHYKPYNTYFDLLSKFAPLSFKNFDREEKNTLFELKEILKQAGLNYISFDNLTRLAVGLGAVYVSQGIVYFKNKAVTQEEFNQMFNMQYHLLKGNEGYANMGDTIDMVCRNLGISILTFEEYFKKFYDDNFLRLKTSSAIMSSPRIKETFQIMNPRKSVKRFSSRQLVDGLNVYQFNIKAIKVVDNDR